MLQRARRLLYVGFLKISRRPVGHGEEIALPTAAGAEALNPPIPTPPATVVSHSARNGGKSHATILVNARRPGESASPESGASRVGPPSVLP